MSSRSEDVDRRTVRDLVAKVNQLEDELEAVRTEMAELKLRQGDQ